MNKKETHMKDKIGISLQDKYGLGGTKVTDYVVDIHGKVKLDTAGVPVKKINSYFTTDLKGSDE